VVFGLVFTFCWLSVLDRCIFFCGGGIVQPANSMLHLMHILTITVNSPLTSPVAEQSVMVARLKLSATSKTLVLNWAFAVQSTVYPSAFLFRFFRPHPPLPSPLSHHPAGDDIHSELVSRCSELPKIFSQARYNQN
jgi:hypothetical protein